MKAKLKQAIRRLIDLSIFLFLMANITYFGVYIVEKYFM